MQVNFQDAALDGKRAQMAIKVDTESVARQAEAGDTFLPDHWARDERLLSKSPWRSFRIFRAFSAAS